MRKPVWHAQRSAYTQNYPQTAWYLDGVLVDSAELTALFSGGSAGLAVRGLAARGLVARGLAVRGLVARGLAVRGLVAAGLVAAGLAVRGLAAREDR